MLETPITTNHHANRAWLGVISLAFAAFVFNTTEFIPIALLTDIGQDFNMSIGHVGIIITIYAWVVALTSLPLLLMVGAMERKRLLLYIFLVFVLSHVICFMAESFTVLVIGRIGVAISHALFWSITAALAVRVAPIGRKSQALGILATGTALATVLGIPIGRIVGQMVGWRFTFLGIGGLALITLVVLLRVLPKLPSENAGSFKSLPILFKRPALVGIFALTAIFVTAHFTVYSYIEPFAEQVAKIEPSYTTFLLLIFGVAGIAGSYIFGRYNGRHPLAFLPISIIVLTVCILILLPVASSSVLLFILSFIWGIASICVGLALQVKVLDLAADATDVAMSIYSGIFNIGIGGGALVGNIVIAKLGLDSLGFVGAGISLVAFGLAMWLFMHYRAQFMISAATPKDDVAMH
ncbi:sugar transporter [Wohlfahrtiimonas chitiniclastica]|uniref:sugar transporter n=1 Tax=Wohlfahrtiimonas chitiniclastica TaxID=400946 RepID=UPI001BCD787F|nr:sugar transporter [Wohlfahrtiimonas chitiniclastica]MBS7816295.1 sugar transporter [Wohlfahrtiimonas chitiniclastica]MBS7821710.1 sugar transporter [Wohlfahrtiimonas chitiniclastica]MBS7829502.1 sugar transporter [Wohlfahrtiimonas chitiniclastica]MBS7831469.1 sugar transporter [Wohlfahrtiimonas chitiniclastica]